MRLTHNGQVYEITNWNEFKETLLEAIGFQVVTSIQKEIVKMKLWDTGQYRKGVLSEVKNGELVLTNTEPYAIYLEYGTYSYWSKHGLSSFPETPDPKKKDITRKQASKLPKGMQPFAPYRRVLWNEKKMKQVINRAAKLGVMKHLS